MNCAVCRHENRPGAKFCEQCAAPIKRLCASCGAELEEALRAAISGANRMFEGGVRAELAKALLGRGDLDRAEHEAQTAVTVAHAQHSRCDELGAHLALAHTQLRRADAAALARAEQALVRA
ncbi:MAG TPA: zinc ribbon domain-containing protein [Candidatus Acidoferrales bacterium]|nr:zinc ribbon domain-containing protein [Candidatus Acidoferrales bacterium]